jgi:WD40 repeat protein
VLLGHNEEVTPAAFSPDGTRVVTASNDATARVWSADGAGEPIVLRGHDKEVWSAAFSPNGRRVVTASRDGTARIWPLTSSDLMSLLWRATPYCVPPEQRRELLGETEDMARENHEACRAEVKRRAQAR